MQPPETAPLIVSRRDLVTRSSSIGRLSGHDILSSVYAAKQSALAHGPNEHSSAVTIQRFFRGFVLRRRLWKEHLAAVTIQRVWRGYHFGRKISTELRQRSRFDEQKRFYDLCATKIQSLFRGYLSRTRNFNYFSRKAELTAIMHSGEETQAWLEKYVKSRREHEIFVAEEKKRRLFDRVGPKLHYLVSTRGIPGVYSDQRLRLRRMAMSAGTGTAGSSRGSGLSTKPRRRQRRGRQSSQTKKVVNVSATAPAPVRGPVPEGQGVGISPSLMSLDVLSDGRVTDRQQGASPDAAPADADTDTPGRERVRRRGAKGRGQTLPPRPRAPARAHPAPVHPRPMATLLMAPGIEDSLRETTRRKLRQSDDKLSRTLQASSQQSIQLRNWGESRRRFTTRNVHQQQRFGTSRDVMFDVIRDQMESCPGGLQGEFLSKRDGRTVAFGRSVYLPHHVERMEEARARKARGFRGDVGGRNRKKVNLSRGMPSRLRQSVRDSYDPVVDEEISAIFGSMREDAGEEGEYVKLPPITS